MIESRKYSEALKNEYRNLFISCKILDNRMDEVNTIVDKLTKNRTVYEKVGQQSGIPWFVVGLLHHGESGMNFKTHLHNGDPLTARTIHVPKGRPLDGQPPFTWEESAKDALESHFDGWKDWSLPGCLYKMECYNGWGYRKYKVWSAYLWAFSTHYSKGKFIADGKWSDQAVHGNAGTAVVLRRMVDIDVVVFEDGQPSLPLLRFGMTSEYIVELQKCLNKLPGIYLKEDGVAGKKTSEAFREATGYYLQGDNR